MKKLNNTDLKQLVENVLINVLKEDVGVYFLDKYKKRFQIIQQKYNNFFANGDYSYALFYNIMVEFDEAKRDFELIKNKALYQYTKLTDDEYYDGITKQTNNEMVIMDFDDSLKQLDSLIEQASDALKQLDEVPYTINIF